MPDGTKKETIREKTLESYEQELSSILGTASGDEDDSKEEKDKEKKEKNKEKVTLEEQPGSIDWNSVLASDPKNVQLNGTVVGAESGMAFVTVNGKDVTLATGQKAGDYVITGITKEKVIFKKNGKELKITMSGVEENSPPAEPPPQPEEPVIDNPPPVPGPKVIDRMPGYTENREPGVPQIPPP